MNWITLLLSLALFSPAPGQTTVPIEKEPRHHLRFENQYVRVFYVLVAPGDRTLFHTHINDGVGIKLSNSRITDEESGVKPVVSATKRGAVGFTHYPSPLTHRVSNIGTTSFRNVFVEVLPSTGTTSKAPLPADVAGHTLVLENDRVRIFRLVLAPGESVEVGPPARGRLRVAVSRGTITVETRPKKIKTVKFLPGESQWCEDGMKYSLRNIGSSSFEAVDIELK